MKRLRWSGKGAEELGWPFEGLFRLLLLTGQRRDEVASLSWGELDRDLDMWTLPAAGRRIRSLTLCRYPKLRSNS